MTTPAKTTTTLPLFDLFLEGGMGQLNLASFLDDISMLSLLKIFISNAKLCHEKISLSRHQQIYPSHTIISTQIPGERTNERTITQRYIKKLPMRCRRVRVMIDFITIYIFDCILLVYYCVF